jgi:O-antigen/teichoic acid export membrane protein
MTYVVARLTTVNILAAATGFVTGPLLARSLGASGRGDLAAIMVPFNLISPILGFGIPAFAYRTIPRGRQAGEVIGSLYAPLFVVGVVAAAAGVPIADALSGGRSTVQFFLVIGFLSTPLILLISLMMSTMGALQRWPNVMAASLTPFMVGLVGISTMFAVGHLTVTTAAAVMIAGSLLPIVPALPVLLRARPVFRLKIARPGIAFGLRSWVGGLAAVGNARLDQLLMITAVSSSQLGLYAVAVTLAGAGGLLSGALAPPLMARIASGETHLMPQAVRIIVEATVCIDIVLALLTPLILAGLFRFPAAIPMALILLVAQVPLCGASILSSALQAHGAPMIPTVGELIALAVTVGGLIVLLGPLQAIGAAIVSLAAYSASFAYQLVKAHRRIDVPVSAFLVPKREDARWAHHRIAEFTARARSVVTPA